MTCVLFDNDIHALKLLESQVSRCGEFDLRGSFSHTSELIGLLKKETVDIVFAEIDAVLSAPKLKQELLAQQRIVFTAANSRLAMNSFAFYTIDYLVKPLTYDRFLLTVAKIRALTPQNLAPGTFLFVKSNRKMHKVSFDDILFIKGEKEYVGLHLTGRRLIVYQRMKDLEAMLPAGFKRVHLSYIVNTAYVQTMHLDHIMICNERIPVSVPYRRELKTQMQNRSPFIDG